MNPYLATIRRYLKSQGEQMMKSIHQQRVELFMEKAGQEVPTQPTEPSEEVRILRAKLILEEALETITALGVAVRVLDDSKDCIDLTYPYSDVNNYFDFNTEAKTAEEPPKFNLNGVVDGCCDIKVVTTGTLSACGVSDMIPQEAVDESNLAKFSGDAHRRADGKWVKPTDWVAPDWDEILGDQMLYRSAEDWCDYFDTYIVDPDGWRQDKTPIDKPISKKDFVRRHMESTTYLGVYQLNEEFKQLMKEINEEHKKRFAPAERSKAEDDGVCYEEPVPVVDDEKVPVGPGDGIRHRVERAASFYKGKMCPKCRTPISDETVKRLSYFGGYDSLSKFDCPECKVQFKAELDGDTLSLVTVQ